MATVAITREQEIMAMRIRRSLVSMAGAGTAAVMVLAAVPSTASADVYVYPPYAYRPYAYRPYVYGPRPVYVGPAW